ncbi:RNA polymerase, sigma-54 factor, partial [human gut metagenome]
NIVLEEDDHTPEDEQPQQISVEEYLREDETPSYKSRINNYSKDDKPRQAPLAGGRSLQEYLVEQLGYRNLSEQDMRLAVYLVGSIEEDGYLRRSLEAIADDIAFTQGVDVSVEHLERLLSIIHELEPTGVGARNLQECLCCNWIRRILIPAPAGWPARSWSAISTSLSKSITKN